jgi:hypothetical protein
MTPITERMVLDRFLQEWAAGDRALARELAVEYVAENRERLAPLLTRYTREGLVAEVDALRAAGRSDDVTVAEMWLLSEYEPVEIRAEIRISIARLVGRGGLRRVV